MANFVEVNLDGLPEGAIVTVQLNIETHATWRAEFEGRNGDVELNNLSPEEALEFEIGTVGELANGMIQFGEVRLANPSEAVMAFSIEVLWKCNGQKRGRWVREGKMPAKQSKWLYSIGTRFN